MTTFTYDTSTDIGKIRLAIGDTNVTDGQGVKPDGTNYWDEELQVYLTLAGSWQRAVAPVMRSLANHYASKATTVWVEAYKEDLTKTASELRAAADDWEKKLSAIGGMGDLFGYEAGAPILFGTGQWGADPENQGSA